ncbi:MAG TPA: Fic family protein [Gammaproteobacteria bacterium]|nr:Fic family protein [Gammaproteobacteria bacterium]
MLSFELSLELVQQLHQLNNAFAKSYALLSNYSDDLKAAIHRYAKISIIGASTRIENAVLTDSEIDWLDTILAKDGKPSAFLAKKALIENKLNKDRERSIEEVAGCRAMLELIYDQGTSFVPLTETIIRGLHQELMRYYQKAGPYVGRYKGQPNSVVETNHRTGESRIVFETTEAGPLTEAAMNDLISWYNKINLLEPRSIAIASELTYRLLAIHPFQDGNGRLGRGLFLLALLQSQDKIVSEVVPYLAIDRHIERKKSEYYYVLNRCSEGKYQRDPKNYHIEYFLQFMIKTLFHALGDIEIYKKRFDAYQLLSESARKILACFKEHPEIRLSRQQLVKMTRLPMRTVTYSLATLSKKQFVQKYGQGAGVRYQLIF